MKAKYFLLIPVSATLVFVACNKEKSGGSDDNEIETTFTLSENQSVSEALADDATNVFLAASADEGLGTARMATSEARVMGCGTVTVTPAVGWPKTMTIDFGSSCTAPDGIERSGIIQIELTDSVHHFDATATMTFDNYKVEGFKVEGTIIWMNKTTPNGIRWTRSIDGKITNPAGDYYWTHVGSKDVMQTEGASTPLNLLDDVYQVTGDHTVTNANGASRSATIESPLVKKVACYNISSGSIKVAGPNHYAVVDYGDGTCDKVATISIDGRPQRTFLLP